MNREEIKYNTKERSENSISEHGSVKSAILFLSEELENCESIWSKYSGDGLGHAITNFRLMVSYLKRLPKEEVKLLDRKATIKKVLNND